MSHSAFGTTKSALKITQTLAANQSLIQRKAGDGQSNHNEQVKIK